MKKTGSETPANDSEKSKAAPAEPVERTRLQADVAKQRVRIAKEELKRARKRLKEAKREARRARKQSAAARKAWKQERRMAAKAKTPDAAAKTAKATVGPRKKQKESKRPAKLGKAGAENKMSRSSKRKKAAPAPKGRPEKTNATQSTQASPKRAAPRGARRTTAKAPRTKVPEQPTLAGVETKKNATVPVTPAANSEQVGAVDSAAGDRAGSEGIPSGDSSAAAGHGT